MKVLHSGIGADGLRRLDSGDIHVEALVDTDAEMIAFLIGCLDALGHPVIKKRLASL